LTAQRRLGAANRGAEVHHRLREIAGTVRRSHGEDEVADLGLGRGGKSVQPGDDAGDVGVDYRDALGEGNRGDGRSGVLAEARQGPKLGRARWEVPVLRHLSGAGDEVAGAGVIAKSGPLGENVLIAPRGQRIDRRPARDESLEPGNYRGDGGLLEHHFAQPHAIGIRLRRARFGPPWQAPEVIHIMLHERRGGVGGHANAMACSSPMAKRKTDGDDAERSCRPRSAGELVGAVGDVSFRRFGFIQGAIVSRWSEIVGERYAKVSSPESIRFPAGRKSGGALTLLVEGAHAPLIQHLTPIIIERVNRFLGYPAVDRVVFKQGRPAAAAPKPKRPELRPVPKELGEGLREIADPELRACLESLASQIAASNGRPSFGSADD